MKLNFRMVKNKNNLLLITLICLVCIPQLSISLYLPSLPHMSNDFNTGNDLMQLTLSIYMVGYAISTLACGIFSDRYGNKPVITFGLFLYLLATVICLYTSNIYVLILGRFLQALGGGCGTVLARVIAKEKFKDKEQLNVLTNLSTAIAVTPAIAPAIGSFIQTYLSWRYCFVFLLVLVSIVLILTLCILEKEKNVQGKKNINLKSIFNNYKLLLTHKIFLAYSVAIGLAWCAYYTFIQSSSFVLQGFFHVSPKSYSLMYALVIIGYIMGTTFTRRNGSRVGLNKVIMYESYIALFSSILMVIAVWIIPYNPFGIIFPMMLLMIGVGGIFPACQAAVMKPFNEIVGTASGLFFFIQMIFGFCCGLILSAFNMTSQLPMVLTILVCCILLVASFYQLIYRNFKEIKRA
ncbi:multidrug effflux MFS transporter [Bacillus cereus]|uniref:multidrug effflux MFS transporter n=1 Tax=Bacillus TaxID=1386 RepID=UPI00117FC35D|nr:multidrug effflux MFS transporter [Bacillus sp. BD59S]MDA1951884.1 multidrug effflux MFS transporter [Bacillus cereus]QDQ04719.1 Bcr/CflA family efflux MFS transporter [Bacillus sp. BD59S]